MNSIQTSTKRHIEQAENLSSTLQFITSLLLNSFFLINAASMCAAVNALFLGQCGSRIDVVLVGSMKLLLKDRVLINGLELGLEVAEDCSAAVGSTSLVGKVVAIVLRLLAVTTP